MKADNYVFVMEEELPAQGLIYHYYQILNPKWIDRLDNATAKTLDNALEYFIVELGTDVTLLKRKGYWLVRTEMF